MFDFSFGEIGVVAVIALLVLGPERLPKVARTAGALVRRARTSWQSVRDEIERELAAEDMKRGLQEARQAAADLRNEFANTTAEARAHADSVMTSLKPPIPEDLSPATAAPVDRAVVDNAASAAAISHSAEPGSVSSPPEPPKSVVIEQPVKAPPADPRDAR
jgi:sec-independent protein translocase protein TatB